MTILSHFINCNVKAYYGEHVLRHLRSKLPGLVSHTRFVDFISSVLLPLCVYLRYACLGELGKTSSGCTYGFKWHLVINDRGELLNVLITPGKVVDRKPVPDLVKKLSVSYSAIRVISLSRLWNCFPKPSECRGLPS
jgi:hypothetical protein